MRLWLTRDEGDKEVGLLWVADEPPMCGGGVYTHVGPCKSISRVMVPGDPGTCTELFTERQVRAIVDSCMNTKRQHWDLWDNYDADPTDENWARLMAEIKGDTI